VSVAEVYQVDRVLIPSYHVWQLSEVFWEEWLQIGDVRVIPWVLDLDCLCAGFSTDDEDATLIPNADAIRTLRDVAHLSHVLAFEDRVLAHQELVVFKRGEEHAVTAAECELVRPLGHYDLIHVACEQLLLDDLLELACLHDSDDVDVALVLAAYYCVSVDFSDAEYVALSLNLVDDLESLHVN